MITVIEDDSQHWELKERACEALASGKLNWRHHGIGVMQAYLEEGGSIEHRLHIWSRSLLKDGIDVSGNAHDHRFDMVSHVLFGAICNTEYELVESASGTWTTMTLVHARAAGAENNYHAPMQPTGKRYIAYPRARIIREGDKYHFPARHFHTSSVGGFTITWVEKYNQSEEPARIVHPIDIPAVPAFGHTPDPGQLKHLEKLALHVLRGDPR